MGVLGFLGFLGFWGLGFWGFLGFLGCWVLGFLGVGFFVFWGVGGFRAFVLAHHHNLFYGGDHGITSLFRVKFLKMVSPGFKLRSRT